MRYIYLRGRIVFQASCGTEQALPGGLAQLPTHFRCDDEWSGIQFALSDNHAGLRLTPVQFDIRLTSHLPDRQIDELRKPLLQEGQIDVAIECPCFKRALALQFAKLGFAKGSKLKPLIAARSGLDLQF